MFPLRSVLGAPGAILEYRPILAAPPGYRLRRKTIMSIRQNRIRAGNRQEEKRWLEIPLCPLRGACAEHCEPTLMRLAHLISVRLVADIRLRGRLCCVVRYDGRRVRLETFHRRRRCRQISPLFERLHYSRRIKPWISVDEVDHLFKLGGAKLGVISSTGARGAARQPRSRLRTRAQRRPSAPSRDVDRRRSALSGSGALLLWVRARSIASLRSCAWRI